MIRSVFPVCMGIMVSRWLSVCPSVHQSVLTELSAHKTSVLQFQANKLSKSQWIFTKFDMCVHIVEIDLLGLGLLIGKFRQF